MILTIKVLDTISKKIDTGIININITKKIHDGRYSFIYEVDHHNLIIKIIKHNGDKIFMNELSIFYYLKKKKYYKTYPKNLVKYLGLGTVVNTSISKFINKKILFMNKFDTFFNYFSLLEQFPLIFFKDYKIFIVRFLYKLLKVCIFLEKEFNLVKFDITLDNIMIYKNDFILIDLGKLVKKDYWIENQTIWDIWPTEKIELQYISNYTLGRIVLNLLFHKKRYTWVFGELINIIIERNEEDEIINPISSI